MESKVKTSIIRNVTANGTWKAQDGTEFFKWEVTTDDGLVGGMMTKTQAAPFEVGAEAQLEVVEKQHNGNTYYQYKKVRAPYAGGGGSKYQPNPERDAQIARMNCVTNAMALVNAGAIKPEDALHIADQLYAYIQTGQNKPLLLNL
jgi:hypothetical protein